MMFGPFVRYWVIARSSQLTLVHKSADCLWLCFFMGGQIARFWCWNLWRYLDSMLTMRHVALTFGVKKSRYRSILHQNCYFRPNCKTKHLFTRQRITRSALTVDVNINISLFIENTIGFACSRVVSSAEKGNTCRVQISTAIICLHFAQIPQGK